MNLKTLLTLFGYSTTIISVRTNNSFKEIEIVKFGSFVENSKAVELSVWLYFKKSSMEAATICQL